MSGVTKSAIGISVCDCGHIELAIITEGRPQVVVHMTDDEWCDLILAYGKAKMMRDTGMVTFPGRGPNDPTH